MSLTMECPHCRQDIPRKGAGRHLLMCANWKQRERWWESLEKSSRRLTT